MLFNNRYADTRGWVRLSAGYMDKGSKTVRQLTLGDSFGLTQDHGMFVAFRDALTGNEFLHRSHEIAEKGLRVELGAYKSHVFLDWRDIKDDGVRPWGALCDMLGGRGVASLDDALRDLELKPVHDALRTLLDPALVKALVASVQAESMTKELPHSTKATLSGAPTVPPSTEGTLSGAPGFPPPTEGTLSGATSSVAQKKLEEVLQELTIRASVFIREAHHYCHSPAAEVAGLGPGREWIGSQTEALVSFRRSLDAALRLPQLERETKLPLKEAAKVIPTGDTTTENTAAVWSSVIAWAAAEALGPCCDPADPSVISSQIFDALRLREVMAESFAAAGAVGEERWRAAARIRASFAHAPWAPKVEESQSRSTAVFSWLHDPDVAWLIGVHEWKGERYFNKESFEQFLWWMSLRTLLKIAGEKKADFEKLQLLAKELQKRLKAAADAGYRVEALLEAGSVRQPGT